MKNPLINPATGRQYSNVALKRAIGLPPAECKRLSPDFTGFFRLNDVTIWIGPSRSGTIPAYGRRMKAFHHRVFAFCPACHRAVPAGRIHQHIKRKDHV